MAFPVILKLMYKGKQIKGDSDRPEGVSIRAWRVVLKKANSAMAFYWHEHFLPLHFGPGAARRYRNVFAPRTLQWLMRKVGITRATVDSVMNKAGKFTKFRTKEDYWREFYRTANQLIDSSNGGINYNYYRGGLMDSVTSTAIVRAFPGRFRIEMKMPSYIPERRKRRTYKNLGQLRKDFGNSAMSDQPDIRTELTAMLSSEIDTLQKIGQRVLVQTMREVLATGKVPAGASS
jgi:hypothetical protein